MQEGADTVKFSVEVLKFISFVSDDGAKEPEADNVVVKHVIGRCVGVE